MRYTLHPSRRDTNRSEEYGIGSKQSFSPPSRDFLKSHVVRKIRQMTLRKTWREKIFGLARELKKSRSGTKNFSDVFFKIHEPQFGRFWFQKQESTDKEEWQFSRS